MCVCVVRTMADCDQSISFFGIQKFDFADFFVRSNGCERTSLVLPAFKTLEFATIANLLKNLESFSNPKDDFLCANKLSNFLRIPK